MHSFGETVSAVLSKITQMLGLKPSDSRRLEEIEHELAASKAANIDRLEALKEKIGKLENQAIQKKKELDAAKGESKRILAVEIERIFRDLDRLQGQEKIINRNIERISMAQAKLDELTAAKDTGLEEGRMDDIAVDLQEAIGGMKTADRETADLERVQYDAPVSPRIDVDSRVSKMDIESQESTGLSPDTEKRLRQIESEEN